jgi:hypothetical protein
MLKDQLDGIMKQGDETVRAPVQNLSDKKALHIIKTPIPQIRDEVIRIVSQGDPIGFLIAVMNGSLVESHIVAKDGEVHTIKTTATVKDRVEIAKFLANKYMPTVAVTKHVVSEGNKTEDGERNLRQIINVAASRRKG